MLLSYDPPFLFVHIDKVAGSSVEIALQPFAQAKRDNRLRRRLCLLGPLTRMGKLYRAVEFPQHSGALVVKNCLPHEVYDGLFKFAFVRNPWDRLVSRYSYLLRNEGHRHGDVVRQMKGFEEYLEWEIRRGKMFQYTYVTDSAGKLIVDFIGYYERLQEDFAKVCARLGVQAQLPKSNASSHRDYRTYYTKKTRELVEWHYQRDVELFGYTFDGLREKQTTLEH